MEAILRDKFVSFLEENNLIRDSQYGFGNKRLCLTNLLNFYNIRDEAKGVDEKAFDKVPYKCLLKKVKSHGVYSKIPTWLGNKLSEKNNASS